MSMSYEVEQKFPVDDLARIEARLRSLGAAISEPRVEVDVYFNHPSRDFAETDAAIPVIPGRKSDSERFAGAVASYTIEAMMGNKWALQSGTSHFLGQNFARAFDIKYLDQNNELQYCWTTSWGLSTRMVGAVIMVHGDDQGLILPPKIAPMQLIIIPIWTSEEEKEEVLKTVEDLTASFSDKVRYKVDDRKNQIRIP